MRYFLCIWSLASFAVFPADYPVLVNQPGKWLAGRVGTSQGRQPTLFFVFTRDCGNCHRSTFIGETDGQARQIEAGIEATIAED